MRARGQCLHPVPGWLAQKARYRPFLPGARGSGRGHPPDSPSEAKDLEISPRFYLSQGVKDVAVFDPYTPLVLHLRKDRVERHISPVTLRLEGCELTV